MITQEFLTELVRFKDDPHGISSLLQRSGFSLPELELLKAPVNKNYPYARNVLHSDEQCEIMLATWTPGSMCSPHDHGASSGWVFYLRGNFQEQSFEWRDGVLGAAGVEDHREGSHIHVGDDAIHSCMSRGEGLSLHFYFPRIESMKVYDVKNQRTLTVSDDCGAWVPDGKDIKEEIRWNIPHSLAL